MTTLWSSNTPARFWQCQPDPSAEEWNAAIQRAFPILNSELQASDLDELLTLTLGEGQYGPHHWRLSAAKRFYYQLKPLIPRSFIPALRRIYYSTAHPNFPLGWPVEDRYVRFVAEVMRQLLIVTGQPSIRHAPLWPADQRFAFVLTHDIEAAKGQAFVRAVADLDEEMGFRSSFNFVPERYPLDYALIDELRERGFEVGIHGLNHSGTLFNSYAHWAQAATRINEWLRELGAVGFRSPLTLRHPEWMQALEIEYDCSFFDTDPYEPIPGGTMSIWPFMLGRFVELPYTLVQDHTLTRILGETSPRRWFEKVDFIEAHQGMALLIAHPDYLQDAADRKIYTEFLRGMKLRGGFWHALPRDVARWWRTRQAGSARSGLVTASLDAADGALQFVGGASGHPDAWRG